MWRLVCAAQSSGIPPPSTATGSSPHASRFVFERAGKVKVRVIKPTQRDVLVPSACGALMGLLPAMDDADMCASMAWASEGGATALHEGNLVKALQVAHIADACSARAAPSAKRLAANALLLVSCNATLALASIGGGGGIKESLQPLRASCRALQSALSNQNAVSNQQTDPSASIAIACAHSVQGALQALHGMHTKAAASLDDALAYMREATGQIDVGLLAAPTAECSVHQLMRVRDVVLDSAVVTWNMCVVFSSGTDAEEEEQQQQCYEYALSECVKFVCAAGSDPGRPIVQMICGAVKTGNLHR
jgi:hypothetical protein